MVLGSISVRSVSTPKTKHVATCYTHDRMADKWHSPNGKVGTASHDGDGDGCNSCEPSHYADGANNVAASCKLPLLTMPNHTRNPEQFWQGELVSLCKQCHDSDAQRLKKAASPSRP